MDKKEYIERSAVSKAILDYGKGAIEDGFIALDPVDDIINISNIVDYLPTDADVMEVVRCKDCKYYEMLPDGKTWCCRCGGMAKIRADGESFCSLAERREQ